MELADLSKDMQRLLLGHWTNKELVENLKEPEYFFEQVVVPRLDYLRRQGEDIPQLRFQKTPTGEWRAWLR